MLLFFVILGYALRAYYWILIAYVLMSWIPELRGTKIHSVVHSIANPYMRIFRGLLVFGAMDFTPILGFVLFNFGMRYYDQMLVIMASQ